jgi:trimethylamine monooxygenase
MDLKKHITFKTVVRMVTYDEKTEKFTVTTENLTERNLDSKIQPREEFDYVLAASGHYSVPYVPTYPGVERFPGRVMHSHDFRDACEFDGKRILVVGASYSAEDIAMQVVKYGASQVICSYRTKPMGFNWPKTITERPILTHVDGKVVHFKDGTTAEVDVIMFCTGYLHYYPFIEDKLRLRSPNLLYPPNLYKGMIFTPEGHNGGSNKMLYLGSQDQYYTYTMFDVEALWALKYVLGEITIPVKDAMIADWKKWSERLRNLKDCHEAILFQTDFVQELAQQCGYGHDLDVSEIFFTWHHHKELDILSYRDQSFSSKFTGTKSPIHHSTFMSALDDSKECFMASK